MTKKEIEGVIAREMPGWRLSGVEKIPTSGTKPGEMIMVTVVNGQTRKVVCISGGHVIGAQG